MTDHRIGVREEWLTARLELLEFLDPLRHRCQLRVLRLKSSGQREQRLDHRLAPLRVDRLRL